MGRNKLKKEPRNWPLTIRLVRSIGLYLNSIAKSLKWSRASVISELIVRFGEDLVNQERGQGASTQHGEGCNTSGVSPPVLPEGED